MAIILHLDDEPLMLDLVEVLLNGAGHDVMSVANSFEALHLLRHEPVDLFIQDLCRPDMDGKTLYQKLKADSELRGIPVLITSGNLKFWPTVALEIKQFNDEFLEKPYDVNKFVVVVNRLLSKSQKI
jgi:DNA-binding NtrC family response regulator